MTSFYSWRLFFLTFEGTPRWGAHGHARARHHEGVEHDDARATSSPPRSRPRARPSRRSHAAREPARHADPARACWRSARSSPASLFKEAFIGHDYEHFWKGSLFTAPDNHILEEMHHVPALGPVAADDHDGARLRARLATCTSVDTGRAGGSSPPQHPVLYRFLLNKWYFDELYDAIFVRPAMRLGRFLWRTGDGRIIDGLGPDGISARVLDVTRGVVRVQTGYVYHYAFAMLIGVAALVTWYLATGAR